MPVQRLDQRHAVSAQDQRGHERRGVAKIGTQLHFGHRDVHAFQVGVVDVHSDENLGQRVPDQFARAQLALRWPFARARVPDGHVSSWNYLRDILSGPQKIKPSPHSYPARDTGRGLLSFIHRLERPLNLLDVIALDDVARLDVFVFLEGHAALLTDDDFLDLVLEALERAELAFVDDHVVADQTHIRAPLHLALGDPATSDLANLGDVEHFEDFGVAEEIFAIGWRQKARHGRLDVVHKVVDHVVIADLDAFLLGQRARLTVGADVEADDGGSGRGRERDVRTR